MRACSIELRDRVGPVRVHAMGICSQVNTHLLVDASLQPTSRAINWQDTRATTEAAELDAQVVSRRDELWGGPFTIDASYALSRLAWLARHEPSAVRDARWLMSPKDYCLAAICGVVVSDTISPVGLVGTDGTYVQGALELVEGAAAMMPPLQPFNSLAGTSQAGNPLDLPAGIPIAVGTMDAWSSVFGSGVVRKGQAMEVAGTSEVMAVSSDRAVPTPGIISFAPVHGMTLHAGPTQAGGSALDWAATAFGHTPKQILELAAAAQVDPQPIVFLPHLAGERAPHWNPDARAVFAGVTSSTELRHLALAVLEGVAFSARQVLALCEHAAGLGATELRISGGAARSHTWNQVKASVHGRSIGVLETLDTGVLGAVLMGLVAAGIETDLTEAVERHVRVASQVEPVPADQPRLDALYEAYREAYVALEPVFSRLARAVPAGSEA